MSHPFTKSDLISDIAAVSPRAIELLAEYGLVCAHCFLNRFDTVETGALLHGMTESEIDDMVSEINIQIQKEAG